ncbi:hypothetical protein HG537_0A05620 [Torulaspora globosa]|uniref:Serine/threonine-protein phosphatase n=1 Tax=Torulaspora globosa TaxID=48254 RepID=A0A7H9HPN7_9SACH|nr:hypothetical protein HG537_0A05620 [Torulaspora sp. CBS 2947]
MGNTGSKTSKKTSSGKSRGNSASSTTQPFTRTDTGQSVRSAKSSRSLRSRRSETFGAEGGVGGGVGEESAHLGTPSGKRDNQGNEGSEEALENESHNNHLQPGTPHSERRLSSSKRSSFTTTDLPPSMIQMEPKSPILKNSNYTSASILNYNENALTDDDDDRTAENIRNSVLGGRNQLDVLRHNNSPRPSSVRSGSSSKARRRSDGETGLSPGQHVMSRSNSHASSIHSRKSSASAGTTAYSTPMNSPGVFRKNVDGIDDQDEDYFGVAASNISKDSNADSASNLAQASSIDSTTSGTRGHRSDIKNLSRRESTNEYPTSLPMDPDLPDGLIDDKSSSNDNTRQSISKKKRPVRPLNIDETIQKLLDAGYAGKRTKNVCLKNSEIARICHMAREMFLSQPSLLELSPPVKIVGDVHGQYADLLRLFTKCGFPPSANFLFLGDYVDRGKQSLETILLLLCYKIKYPENFFLLRGNHECANVTRVYGFYDECKRRCNIKTWKIFIDTFNTLPLAAIVAGKIFCVHGGLSPVLNSMDEIRHVSRPTDVPDFGLINDLLWSDPTDSPNEWEDNERGVSYCYNKVAINKFLNKFGFDLVCRAHMVVEDGYEFFNDRSLVTVFSAPNYCGEFDNWGAVMSVSEGLLCSFELLDPLDGPALKQVMKKGRQERKLANQQQMQVQQ